LLYPAELRGQIKLKSNALSRLPGKCTLFLFFAQSGDQKVQKISLDFVDKEMYFGKVEKSSGCFDAARF
jgi:hypothetical protein